MTADEIVALASQFKRQKQNWHFHILTPTCQLNKSGKFTLVLENTTTGKEYEVFSDEPFMGVGEQLVKLLHGDDVVKSESEEHSKSPTNKVKKIVKRAGELTKKGVFWHHHMLFPGCKFNAKPDKWVIVFEDAEKSEIIENVSDAEPKSDLQYIEGLFYSQKK
jgi:hypothetical protein